MIGDAVAHSVLPGLVVASLLTGARSPSAMSWRPRGGGRRRRGDRDHRSLRPPRSHRRHRHRLHDALRPRGPAGRDERRSQRRPRPARVLSGQRRAPRSGPRRPRRRSCCGAVDATLPREFSGRLLRRFPALLALVWRPLKTAVFDPCTRARAGRSRGSRAGLFTLRPPRSSPPSRRSDPTLVIALPDLPGSRGAPPTRADASSGTCDSFCAYGLFAGVTGYLLATRAPRRPPSARASTPAGRSRSAQAPSSRCERSRPGAPERRRVYALLAHVRTLRPSPSSPRSSPPSSPCVTSRSSIPAGTSRLPSRRRS